MDFKAETYKPTMCTVCGALVDTRKQTRGGLRCACDSTRLEAALIPLEIVEVLNAAKDTLANAPLGSEENGERILSTLSRVTAALEKIGGAS